MNERPWWLLPPGHISPVWWLGLGAGMLWIDHITGMATQFPVVYVLPVCLAAWYSGRGAALALAVAVPLVRLAFLAGRSQPEDLTSLVLRQASAAS